MRFDLTDLRLFVNVVEAGSLTGGAECSHLTLASASQRVLGMEDALGAKLLTRHRHGVRPTDAGRTLLHHARLVLTQVEDMRAELAAFGQGLRGRVRLLCNTSAMTEHLPPLLARFLAAHPLISVDLEERTSDQIVDALRAGLAELGIVSDAASVAGLESTVFARDDLVLLVPKDDALAAGRARGIDLADVVERDFVGLAAGSALQAHVAAQAKRLGRRLRYRVQVGSFEAVCRMVAQGIGVAVVPRTAAAPDARRRDTGLRVLPLRDAWARRHLLVCSRGGEPLSRHAQLLRAALLES